SAGVRGKAQSPWKSLVMPVIGAPPRRQIKRAWYGRHAPEDARSLDLPERGHPLRLEGPAMKRASGMPARLRASAPPTGDQAPVSGRSIQSKSGLSATLGALRKRAGCSLTALGLKDSTEGLPEPTASMPSAGEPSERVRKAVGCSYWASVAWPMSLLRLGFK